MNTDREQKLISYITFLIGVLNVCMMFIANMYKSADWLEKQFVNMNMKTFETEMLDNLKSEFGVPFSIVLDKDVIVSTKDGVHE